MADGIAEVPAERRVLTGNPSLPPLSKLRAFEAAARLGSITGAGEELSVSAGAVSRHIKELEAELGVPVLEREGRGVRLTDDGRSLYSSLQPAFDMIAGAVRQARRDPRRMRLTVMTGAGVRLDVAAAPCGGLRQPCPGGRAGHHRTGSRKRRSARAPPTW